MSMDSVGLRRFYKRPFVFKLTMNKNVYICRDPFNNVVRSKFAIGKNNHFYIRTLNVLKSITSITFAVCFVAAV